MHTRRCIGPSFRDEEAVCEGDSESNLLCDLDPCPVLGVWNEWSGWGDCLVECGTNGVEERNRSCEMPDADDSGDCEGQTKEQRACVGESSVQCGPINGGWSKWSEWTVCSASCGNHGFATKVRRCNSPTPSNGGSYCSGRSRMTQPCNRGVSCIPPPVTIPPVILGEWSDWESCSVTCGSGIQRRSRTCESTNVAACNGFTEDTKACVGNTCPVDGRWSPWSRWSSCSVPCGNEGIEMRMRECIYAVPRSRGKGCQGQGFETRACNSDVTCPVGLKAMWSPWTDWGVCSVSCGEDGFQARVRECLNSSENDTCDGSIRDSKPCDVIPPCPVDGEYINQLHTFSRFFVR